MDGDKRMIDIARLKGVHIGRWVVYTDQIAKISQEGRIKSWNDQYIFVVYHCDKDWIHFQNYTAAATDPRHLRFNRGGY